MTPPTTAPSPHQALSAVTAQQALKVILDWNPKYGGYRLSSLKHFRRGRGAALDAVLLREGTPVAYLLKEDTRPWQVQVRPTPGKDPKVARAALLADLDRVARQHLKPGCKLAATHDGLLTLMATTVEAHHAYVARLRRAARTAIIGVLPDMVVHRKLITRQGDVTPAAIERFVADHPGVLVLNDAIREAS
jgi:hypothetical protein